MKGKSYLSLGAFRWVSPVPLLITTSLNPGWNESPGGGYDRTASPYRSEDYDEAELEMALAWADKNFRYGKMKITNSINAMPSKAAQFCGKFTDGDVYPRHDARQQQTGDIGRVEESLGYNAIAAGFQGNVTGPINIPMATPPKRSLTVI